VARFEQGKSEMEPLGTTDSCYRGMEVNYPRLKSMSFESNREHPYNIEGSERRTHENSQVVLHTAPQDRVWQSLPVLWETEAHNPRETLSIVLTSHTDTERG
jgi:hypothetical protein